MLLRQRWVEHVLRVLPEGRLLPEEVWQRRHRLIVRIALAQAVALAGVATAAGHGGVHAVADAVLVAVPAVLARYASWGRKGRSAAATTSLMLASATLVHLTSGLTESHFHFFVMIGVVSLYQDWVPFLVAVGIVVAHHGVMGTADPHAVYSNPHAWRHPWLWAGVHGGFVLAASLANLAAWRLNEQQGLRDPLTGMANRTLLEETLTRMLTGSAHPVSVLFVDLDDFKTINDTRGHAAGDEVLRTVAERLRSCVRGGDVVARLGGDEFAVLVDGPSAAADTVGARVLRALREPVVVDGRSLFLGASVGVADTSATPERTAQSLLLGADLAMYAAKGAGKGHLVHYAGSMADAFASRAQLQQDLALAAASGQLEVHYQPTVQLERGHVRGYEALLRWRHPERGLVPPSEFVPIAEESGLIGELTTYVLHTATAQAARWSEEIGRSVSVAVNLSPVDLAGADIVSRVTTALAAAGLPAHQLTLEITEGVLVHDLRAVAATLTELRSLGLRVAIDDFGTGYSSLSYLRQLPVDVIKIDRSFVSDLDGAGTSAVLVSSIVELARSLGLDVVAEGVETGAQASTLRDLHCPHAQGYLYARPVPAAEARHALDALARVPGV
ncbi:diguanylate cyclase (GGDEF)-like protein [Motilibacter peucedani]|uniref:Diguanylate cyclase (GGDEF)-like protein n=1 Tax=Motilibacter peucedani TaxID=598650 RepID=A0A420XT09_9ACTN|nr:EAL domain-containing protein [Motilibacter peucedani]RKS79944.1 diguanylate cyclase (GGDEF)-like protein [Motilibacter peucedani]